MKVSLDRCHRLVLCAMVALLAPVSLAMAGQADASGEPTSIDLGKFELEAPAAWKRVQPKSRIVAYEFAAPAAEGDKTGGRLTIMSAGGSVEANIDRWYDQFTQPDGKASKDVAKVKEETIAGQKVHLVDIAGTYKDRPAPFAPGVDREKYRMLAAIIVTEQGNFFVKMYGPERTMAAQEKAFTKMIEGLSRK